MVFNTPPRPTLAVAANGLYPCAILSLDHAVRDQIHHWINSKIRGRCLHAQGSLVRLLILVIERSTWSYNFE
jgi:hypothetical protein